MLYNLLSGHPNKFHTHLTPYIVTRILLTKFPTPYFTSPWVFYNYQILLLNLFTFFTHPPNQSPIWQLSKFSLYVWISVCPTCLVMLCFFKIQLLIDMYLLPFYYSYFHFFLLFKDDPLTFYAILVWWWWTPLAFSCLRNSLYIYFLVLNDRVILAVVPCITSLWIFLANPFWPAKFLWSNQLIVFCYLSCR